MTEAEKAAEEYALAIVPTSLGIRGAGMKRVVVFESFRAGARWQAEQDRAEIARLRSALRIAGSAMGCASRYIEFTQKEPHSVLMNGLKEIDEALSQPSRAHEEWEAMKAVCEAVEDMELEQLSHLCTRPTHPCAECDVVDALVKWRKIRGRG